MIRRAAAPLLFAALLGGCQTTGGGSVTRGECKVFERPPYEVKGRTQYDQDVADNFVESGVGGCKWPRPAARPPEIDVPRAVAPHKTHARPKKKMPLWLKMLRWPKAAPPVEVTPAPLPAAAPPPAPAPRSAIDQLLYPDEGVLQTYGATSR